MFAISPRTKALLNLPFAISPLTFTTSDVLPQLCVPFAIFCKSNCENETSPEKINSFGLNADSFIETSE